MKLNINSARKGNSGYTFSPLSLVSLDFGRLQPIRSFSVIPGSKFSSVVGKGLLRCTPQVFPPFGRMNLKSASFFVPDSQIYSWSSAFHSDSKVWRGQAADKTPYFMAHEFNAMFISNGFISGLSTLIQSNPVSDLAQNTYDFTYPNNITRAAGKTNLDYYQLTAKGWKVYAIFKSLGYDFLNFPTDNAFTYSNAYNHAIASSTEISIVKFLAYCKIWNDFFCNSYEADVNLVASYLQSIYLNKDISGVGITYYDSSTFKFNFDLAFDMLNEIHVPYESNMYTNAWNSVNDPTGVENTRLNQTNQQSLISPFGRNIDGEFGSLDVGASGNAHRDSPASHGGTYTYFTQLGHKTLEAFDKFVRRRNLVGSKAVQQLYALFGVDLAERTKDYVIKLSENSSRVQFSAITSQSDTENGAVGKPLGAFAGTGLGGFDVSFSYDANTFGNVIVLTWLNIDPILMHGIEPDNLRIKPLDFYSPDYDGKAYRPIPYLEITGAHAIGYDGFHAKSIYGYTNMYDDYRHMRDLVAGSFLDPTTKNFAFMRDLTNVRESLASIGVSMVPQIKQVQYWQMDGSSDLTNPFITGASAGDRFWFCVDWNIKCTLPILSSENSFDLDGEGNLTITKNGDGMA